MRRIPTRLLVALVCLVVGAACRDGGGLVKQYEYEEEIYLDLDGSATVVVNASLPALLALRGLTVDPDPDVRVDRTSIRRLYESSVADVTRVSRPWRRSGRRFVQVRVEIPDIRRLSEAAPFAWSKYSLTTEGDIVAYRQQVGAPPSSALTVPVEWRGDELVAFRLHAPSKVRFHNAPSKTVERGNIVVYEQPLRERFAGTPVDIDVRMEPRSILYTTLIIFGLAFVAAMSLLGSLIWWVRKKGRERTNAAA